MSDPSVSPSLPDPLQSDAVSLNEETLIQPDSETALPAAAVTDPAEENSLGEEEEDDDEEGEGEEIDDETPAAASSTMDLRFQPPITDLHVSAPDVALASPTARRGGSKRKKGKGKGKAKSKPNAMKLKVIEEKLRNLKSNLNPVPFIPRKILDFAHHEKLFKKLGLWKFLHTDFDRTIRADFIAQLVANYNPKLRSSYVNECRVMVNRADLARAFELPLKKEKGNAAAESEVDLDFEVLSDDSLAVIVKFVSDWVLLHEDMWMMPNEVMNWMKLIKEGHPEKVDFASLFWFMVEKELKQGAELKDCYYASHLQHLIKHQREDVFLMAEPADSEVESGAEGKVVEDGDNEGNVKDSIVVETLGEEIEEELVVEGPCTELTLGKEEAVKEEVAKEVEMMDAEKCKDSDEDVGGEEGEEREEQGQWLLNGKNNLGQHFMQHCSTGNTEEFVSFEDRKDEEEEEEEEMDGEEDGEEDEEEAGNFDVFPNDDSLEGNGFTGNFLQGMEANQMAFGTQEQLPNSTSVDVRGDVQHIASTPSFFNNSGKRVIEHDYHHTVNDSNKRLRINETWDNNPVDFGMCMEKIQEVAQKARMLYEEKEQAAEQSAIHQQMLLDEVQKRDEVIDHLHKAKMEEAHKKDIEIGRLERELCLMGSILEGYRTALKDVKKTFAEYRAKAQLAEESTYKDAGPGGLMLTAAEIERRCKKKQEEYKMHCLFIEQKMREVEDEYNGRFDALFDKVNLMDKRLIGLEADAKELIILCLKKKNTKTEEEEEEADEDEEEEDAEEEVEEMHEAAETLPVPEPGEPVIEEVSEPVTLTEPEEQVPEVAEPNLAIPQSDEKVLEAAEPDLAIPQGDEKVLEAAEPDLAISQGDEKVLEAAEPDLAIPQGDEKVLEAAEPDLAIPQGDEKVIDVAEPLSIE